jgi:hypothetical protein
MSRFLRKPFHPSGPFIALRSFVMGGREYEAGDDVPTSDIESRRIRQMWEMRMIETTDQRAPRPAQRPVTARADAQTAGAGPETPARGSGRARAEHRGFGRHFVVAPDGTETGPMTRDEAEAAVAAIA